MAASLGEEGDQHGGDADDRWCRRSCDCYGDHADIARPEEGDAERVKREVHSVAVPR
jgi:hypothetical protein